MKVEDTPLSGCKIIHPKVFKDGRGYFFESFNKEQLERLLGIPLNFVQDNQSSSTYGVIRGLHKQSFPFEQAKLVRVITGRILDVAVDLRPNSPTYKKWVSVELSADNNKQLFIPQGFLHGFSVLSEEATVSYKCDSYYKGNSEFGIRYNDPELAIDWKVPTDKIVLSRKDNQLLYMNDVI